jgi:diaminopimelate decarboxylase
VESAPELHQLNEVALAMGKRAPITFRVNPDVDPKTHPYISTGLKANKFGIAYTDTLALYRLAASLPGIEVTGIECHIGSQITTIAPYEEALIKLLHIVDTLAEEGITLDHIDLGGGIGIQYTDEVAVDLTAYAQMVNKHLADRKLALYLEPGRSIVGNAGILLTRALYLKHGEVKNFAIVDAAMNDLIRPALYQAHHDVCCVNIDVSSEEQTWQIVGPVCESGDFLAHDRNLRLAGKPLLAVLSAGAYGMVQASNYNTRPRVAEVMVAHNSHRLIRKREHVEDLYAHELI